MNGLLQELKVEAASIEAVKKEGVCPFNANGIANLDELNQRIHSYEKRMLDADHHQKGHPFKRYRSYIARLQKVRKELYPEYDICLLYTSPSPRDS